VTKVGLLENFIKKGFIPIVIPGGFGLTIFEAHHAFRRIYKDFLERIKNLLKINSILPIQYI